MSSRPIGHSDTLKMMLILTDALMDLRDCMVMAQFSENILLFRHNTFDQFHVNFMYSFCSSDILLYHISL